MYCSAQIRTNIEYSIDQIQNQSDRVEESSSVYATGLSRASYLQELWKIIEEGNSSTDFLQSPIIERQGVTGTVNIGRDLDSFLLFPKIFFSTLPPIKYKKISLGEARRHAIMVLENAERRREVEREIEAKFWESLDK
ncbi:MAG: hypothetical protein L6422_11855 [Candidatus Marinimicrobia bacterium]|nr:hypothetical protein [bacterium]MCG2716939.1 hypothetical protein [Candidatus Neomarinimicrobiota bacterium]